VPESQAIAVLLGIGLNVNMEPELLKTISQPATSLLQLTGKTWELSEILSELTERFLQHLEVLKEKNFAPFQERFEKLLAHLGQTITLRDGEQPVTGICQGITTEGHLKLLLPSGEVRVMPAGEIILQRLAKKIKND
jgi:BirA family transcriptional regulator, biotin operon repressor / biotin---[acetyl-CoA-carboxylase] ligase